MKLPPPTYRIAEAARLLSLPDRTIRDIVERHGLGTRDGKAIKLSASEVRKIPLLRLAVGRPRKR